MNYIEYMQSPATLLTDNTRVAVHEPVALQVYTYLPKKEVVSSEEMPLLTYPKLSTIPEYSNYTDFYTKAFTDPDLSLVKNTDARGRTWNLCATFLTNGVYRPILGDNTFSLIRKSIGKGDRTGSGLSGDAWNWVHRNKGTLLLNAYKGTTGNTLSVYKLAKEVASSSNFKERLQAEALPGDIVLMLGKLAPTSNQQKATDWHAKHHIPDSDKVGNSHIGIVISRNNEKYVVDFSGVPYSVTRLSNVINPKFSYNFLITGLFRPDMTSIKNNPTNASVKSGYDLSEFGITPTFEDSRINYGGLYNLNLYNIGKFYHDNKDLLKLRYNLTDEEFNELVAISMGLMHLESFAGSPVTTKGVDNYKYLSTANLGKYYTFKRDLAQRFSTILRDIGFLTGLKFNNEESVTPGNIKLSQVFTKDALELRGIKLPHFWSPREDFTKLEDPLLGADLVPEAYLEKVAQTKDLFANNPELLQDADLIKKISILSYNLGLGNIKKDLDLYNKIKDSDNYMDIIIANKMRLPKDIDSKYRETRLSLFKQKYNKLASLLELYGPAGLIYQYKNTVYPSNIEYYANQSLYNLKHGGKLNYLNLFK